MSTSSNAPEKSGQFQNEMPQLGPEHQERIGYYLSGSLVMGGIMAAQPENRAHAINQLKMVMEELEHTPDRVVAFVMVAATAQGDPQSATQVVTQTAVCGPAPGILALLQTTAPLHFQALEMTAEMERRSAEYHAANDSEGGTHD